MSLVDSPDDSLEPHKPSYVHCSAQLRTLAQKNNELSVFRLVGAPQVVRFKLLVQVQRR